MIPVSLLGKSLEDKVQRQVFDTGQQDLKYTLGSRGDV